MQIWCVHLGSWVYTQREAHRGCGTWKMTLKCQEKLEGAVFVCNPHEKSWENNLKLLLQYKGIHDNCSVHWNCKIRGVGGHAKGSTQGARKAKNDPRNTKRSWTRSHGDEHPTIKHKSEFKSQLVAGKTGVISALPPELSPVPVEPEPEEEPLWLPASYVNHATASYDKFTALSGC